MPSHPLEVPGFQGSRVPSTDAQSDAYLKGLGLPKDIKGERDEFEMSRHCAVLSVPEVATKRQAFRAARTYLPEPRKCSNFV